MNEKVYSKRKVLFHMNVLEAKLFGQTVHNSERNAMLNARKTMPIKTSRYHEQIDQPKQEISSSSSSPVIVIILLIIYSH
jgi:hypothetical protein